MGPGDGGAALGGDNLIGLSIDLEELHSASRALEARVDVLAHAQIEHGIGVVETFLLERLRPLD